VDWAKPMSETMSDDILGEFRWNELHFVGRLTSGVSKIKTAYWIDLFVAPGGQPQETLSNIARLRRLVQEWGEWESRIKEAILHNIYPEYHKCCDIRQDSIRHDEIGFWSELEVVSLLSESDGSVVVRYHSGDMFGSYRVEAVILGDQITCRVAY
ncbi:MAG: hypothetical protein MUC83_18430, partial [Pirellula sp.]|nr:hypothetical protein [Pirellula sp.]